MNHNTFNYLMVTDGVKIEKREKEQKEDIWIENHKNILIMNNYDGRKRERRYINPSLPRYISYN